MLYRCRAMWQGEQQGSTPRDRRIRHGEVTGTEQGTIRVEQQLYEQNKAHSEQRDSYKRTTLQSDRNSANLITTVASRSRQSPTRRLKICGVGLKIATNAHFAYIPNLRQVSASQRSLAGTTILLQQTSQNSNLRPAEGLQS